MDTNEQSQPQATPVSDPSPVITSVLDVRQSTLSYFSSHPGYYVLFFVLIAGGFFYGYLTGDYTLTFYSVIVCILIYGLAAKKVRDRMMAQFAESLQYAYVAKGDSSTLQGTLFSIGYDKNMTDVISSKDVNIPVRIFLYSYTVGGGKSSHTYPYTVFENTFGSPVPHILLNRHVEFLSLQDSSIRSDLEKISLEGDFDKYFSLSVQAGFETEAYEIFTPDFMQELIDTSKLFDFEFSGDKLYIYLPKFIGTRAELDSMFALSKALSAKLVPTIARMKGDVNALKSYYK